MAMRVLVLLAVFVAAVVFYNVGGNRLDEAKVRDYYASAEQAMLAFDDERLCAMVDEDFEQVSVTRIESMEQRETFDRDGYCRTTAETMARLRQLQGAMGGRSPVRLKYTLVSIRIAPDKRSAEVESRSTLEMPGIRMTSRARDVVVRKRWKVLATRSTGTTLMGPAYR